MATQFGATFEMKIIEFKCSKSSTNTTLSIDSSKMALMLSEGYTYSNLKFTKRYTIDGNTLSDIVQSPYSGFGDVNILPRNDIRSGNITDTIAQVASNSEVLIEYILEADVSPAGPNGSHCLSYDSRKVFLTSIEYLHEDVPKVDYRIRKPNGFWSEPLLARSAQNPNNVAKLGLTSVAKAFSSNTADYPFYESAPYLVSSSFSEAFVPNADNFNALSAYIDQYTVKNAVAPTRGKIPGDGETDTQAIGGDLEVYGDLKTRNIKANNFVGHLEGNADTTTALHSPREIRLEGRVLGSVTFDGTSDVILFNTINPAADTGGRWVGSSFPCYDRTDPFWDNSNPIHTPPAPIPFPSAYPASLQTVSDVVTWQAAWIAANNAYNTAMTTATNWNKNNSYVAGDWVKYNSIGYTAKGTIAAGTDWNEADWQREIPTPFLHDGDYIRVMDDEKHLSADSPAHTMLTTWTWTYNNDGTPVTDMSNYHFGYQYSMEFSERIFDRTKPNSQPISANEIESYGVTEKEIKKIATTVHTTALEIDDLFEAIDSESHTTAASLTDLIQDLQDGEYGTTVTADGVNIQHPLAGSSNTLQVFKENTTSPMHAYSVSGIKQLTQPQIMRATVSGASANAAVQFCGASDAVLPLKTSVELFSPEYANYFSKVTDAGSNTGSVAPILSSVSQIKITSNYKLKNNSGLVVTLSSGGSEVATTETDHALKFGLAVMSAATPAAAEAMTALTQLRAQLNKVPIVGNAFTDTRYVTLDPAQYHLLYFYIWSENNTDLANVLGGIPNSYFDVEVMY